MARAQFTLLRMFCIVIFVVTEYHREGERRRLARAFVSSYYAVIFRLTNAIHTQTHTISLEMFVKEDGEGRGRESTCNCGE